jgi:Domain of unknown function (DUF4384)
MSSRLVGTKPRHAAPIALIAVGLFCLQSLPFSVSAWPTQDTTRTITADDFIKHRPASNARPDRRRPRATGRYRLASQSSENAAARPSGSPASQLGLTMWRLRSRLVADRSGVSRPWNVERVEADTRFREDDNVRLSLECPRAGYLYVIDRDWFTDGQTGETKLIFPLRGENNRLRAGRVVTIPAQDQLPFKATPKENQAGELLIIIVTSAPIALRLSNDPLTISELQLQQWEKSWGAHAERFELEGGAGQPQTQIEQEASSRKETRQLTRDDPAPQTIYLVSPTSNDGFLVHVKLYYTL